MGKQTFWLGVGIGSIALVVGYMVGASQTPVISVVAPAVFGLVITALGFIGGSGSDKKIEVLKELLAQVKSIPQEESIAAKIDVEHLGQVEREIAVIKDEIILTPERVGKMLVIFTSFYILGLSFGTYARVTNLYSPTVARKLPWVSSPNIKRPPTSADAVDWIALQDQLLERGYTTEQINEIYKIQVDEWDKNQASASASPVATTGEPNQSQNVAAAQNSNNQKSSMRLSGKLNESKNNLPRPATITVVGPAVTLPQNRPPNTVASPTPESNSNSNRRLP
jgi:hypothetical protein